MLSNSLSQAGSAAWPQRHRVGMWCSPQTAHLLQKGSHQPIGRSLEQGTGLSTLLPEVNLNPQGSVQLWCAWKEEGFIMKAEASTGEVWKAVSPPYPMLLLTPALSTCPSSTVKILIKFSSKLVFSSSSFLMSNQAHLWLSHKEANLCAARASYGNSLSHQLCDCLQMFPKKQLLCTTVSSKPVSGRG